MFFTSSLTAASFHSLPPLSDVFISPPLFSALFFTSHPLCSALFFPCYSLAFTAVSLLPFLLLYFCIVSLSSYLFCFSLSLFNWLFPYVGLLLYYLYTCLTYRYYSFPFLIALFFFRQIPRKANYV